MKKFSPLQILSVVFVIVLIGMAVYFRLVPSKDLSLSATNSTTKVHEISVKNFAFEPNNITIKAGETVKFRNLDIASHTATSDDGSSFDTGLFGKDEEAQVTIKNPGSYDFHCAPHPKMRGKIIVE